MVDEEGHRGFNIGMEHLWKVSYSRGPPNWFLEYFGRLDKSLGEIKQQQAEIIQNQKRQEEYIDRLGNAYCGIRHYVDRRSNFYVELGS